MHTQLYATTGSQRQELNFYRQMLWQNSMVCQLDATGCIQHVNPWLEQMLDLDGRDLVGHSYTTLLSVLALPSETIERVLADIRSSFERKTTWRGELCFYTGNHTLAWADVSIVPITDADGQVLRYILAGYDITYQKNQQHRIHSVEQALQDAHAVANLGSWTYQLQTHRIIWSEQVFKIYGLMPETTLLREAGKGFVAPSPQQLLAYFHPDDKPLYEKAVATAIQKGESFDLDLRIHTPQGELRHIQLVGRPLFAHHKYVTHVHGTVMDITARKQAQLQLVEQNEQLREINQQLDRFVYSAAHDLRAPLMSLLGLIGLMEEEVAPSEKVLYLNLMKQSISRMDGCIGDIVDFSRNSRTPLQIQEIDLAALCTQLWEQLSFATLPGTGPKREQNSLVAADRRTIAFQVSREGDSAFYSDLKRVTTLASNFLSNAIRYSDSEKPFPFVRVHVHVQADKALLTIEDNGIGIAPEHIEKIFDMFYRATDSKTGSGLGLFIVKEILSTLGGQIQVASTEGEGTRFVITLPNQGLGPMAEPKA